MGSLPYELDAVGLTPDVTDLRGQAGGCISVPLMEGQIVTHILLVPALHPEFPMQVSSPVLGPL